MTYMHGCVTDMHGCMTDMHGCMTDMHGYMTDMNGWMTGCEKSRDNTGEQMTDEKVIITCQEIQFTHMMWGHVSKQISK